jgi:hypothetical protein
VLAASMTILAMLAYLKVVNGKMIVLWTKTRRIILMKIGTYPVTDFFELFRVSLRCPFG